MEPVNLDIDGTNELLFRVTVEGLKPSSTIVRLVCEGEGVLGMVFNGSPEGDVVRFEVPRLRNVVPEGSYTGKIEVLFEGRYFNPIKFPIELRPTVRVVAESVAAQPRPNVNVKAQLVTLRDRYRAKRP